MELDWFRSVTRTRLATLLLVLGLFGSLIACGSSSSAPPKSSTPTFSSSPSTTAAQGQPYTYTLAASDPAGSPITFALTSAPVGATISNGTITWTPTGEQARQNNGFTVTATSDAGGTATQSWAVAPTGTVNGSLFIMHWSADQTVGIEANSTLNYSWAALVPQSDGSLNVLPGTGSPDATFTIPNVQAGYYWLQFQPGDVVWTNASDMDYGADAIGHLQLPFTTQVFGCDITGMDPFDPVTQQLVLYSVNAQAFELGIEDQSPGDPAPAPFPTSGSTVCNADPTVSQTGGDFGAIEGISGISPAKADVSTVEQFETAPSGTLAAPFNNVFEIGPAFNESLDIEGNYPFPFPTYIVPGTLSQTDPQSQDFTVTFSAWESAFNAGGPSPAAVPLGFAAELSAQQQSSMIGRPTPMWSGASPNLVAAIATAWPQDGNGYNTWPGDGDFGTVNYNNPFTVGTNANFTNVYEVVAAAGYQIPLSNSVTLYPVLTDIFWTATQPTGFAPILPPVGSPQINGASLFTAATLSSVTPTLSWTAPNAGAPVIYTINICAPVQAGDCSNPGSALYSFSQYTGTSFTVPGGILTPGTAYLFFIGAEMRTGYDPLHPQRFSLPWGQTWTVSSVMTVSSSATPGMVHGDRSLIVAKRGNKRPGSVAEVPAVGSGAKPPYHSEWRPGYIVESTKAESKDWPSAKK
jgi:hypothetical protein